MTASCQNCGAQFATFQCHIDAGGKKGTHCQKCRSRKRQVPVSCSQCGFNFSVKESEHNNNKTGHFYCSQTCMGLWRTANWVGSAHHNFKDKIEVECCICGAKKLLHESQFKMYDQFLCSNACRSEFNHRRAGLRDTSIVVPCDQCGADVKCLPSRLESYEKVFCNIVCRGLWASRNLVKENNCNYRGGKEFSCYVCKNPVWITPSEFVRERHYCSIACSETLSGSFTSGVLNHRWKGGPVKRSCEICGTEFETKLVHIENGFARFCSRKCFAKALIKILTPEQQLTRRLNRNMGRKIWVALRKSKGGVSWQTLLGYTVGQLKTHLESLFLAGMDWSNYGIHKNCGPLKWSIDHIKPKSSFTFQSPDDPEFMECWSLENLRPFWGPDNSAKCDRSGYTPRVTLANYSIDATPS